MWEVRVQHDGLKAYRVVRGATQQEAELKARLQVAAWNERWSSKEAALKSKMQKLQKSWSNEENKQTARTRTEESQSQINAVEVILAEGLQRRPLQWN